MRDAPAQGRTSIGIADEIVGYLEAGSGALGFLTSAIFIALALYLWLTTQNMADGTDEAGLLHKPVALLVAAIFLVVLSVVHVMAGIGILRGRKVGFIVAAVIGLLSLAANGLAVIGLGVGIYSILRLTGKLGPKPI